MKNIIIITKTIVGIRPNPFGFDGRKNLLGKPFSRILQENLTKELSKRNMGYKVTIDTSYESLDDLLNKGVDLLLISPYIKAQVDLSRIDKSKYYILSEEEFNTGNINKIIEFLK